MERELHYAQTRFASALALLEGRALNLLGGWRDTVNNRLRCAVLEVYACVPHNFARRSEYDALAQLLLDLRLRTNSERVLSAIANLTAPQAEEFVCRLATIARCVLSHTLPSERFGSRQRTEGRTG